MHIWPIFLERSLAEPTFTWVRTALNTVYAIRRDASGLPLRTWGDGNKGAALSPKIRTVEVMLLISSNELFSHIVQ